MAEIFVCRASFTFEHEGVPGVVHRGATVRAGHPIMRGREEMFEPLTVEYELEKPKRVSVK